MIQRRVVVPVEPFRLWRALTDPVEAGSWLGGDLEWIVEEGRQLRFSPTSGPSAGDRDPARVGQVEEVVPGRFLRFVWWPEGAGPESASRVTYRLEPVGADRTGAPGEPPEAPSSTILTVQEAPLVPSRRATAGSASCSVAGPGWSRLDQLQLHVWAARHLAGELAG